MAYERLGFWHMLRYTIPLFVAGMGSALEVYPVPHQYIVRSIWGGLGDGQRLASDWYRVGHALYSTIDRSKIEVENTVGKEKTADVG